MCMRSLPSYISVCPVPAWNSQNSEEGAKSPATTVTGHHMGAKN